MEFSRTQDFERRAPKWAGAVRLNVCAGWLLNVLADTKQYVVNDACGCVAIPQHICVPSAKATKQRQSGHELQRRRCNPYVATKLHVWSFAVEAIVLASGWF